MSLSRFSLIICATVLTSVEVLSDPLLPNSQQSYVFSCLNGSQSIDRKVQICEAALLDSGLTQTERVDLKLALAEVLYVNDEYDRSNVQFNDVLRSDPGNIRALSGLGWNAFSQGEMREASVFFQESLNSGPTSGSLAGYAASLRRLDQIDEDTFLSHVDAALTMSPNDAWTMREKGWGLLEFNRLLDAENVARKALELEPDNPAALLLLGSVLNDRDKWDEAYEHLNKAAQLEDDWTAIYSQRSLAAFYKGYLKIALKDADRVIASWPDSPTGYVRRARALEQLGRRDDAIAELKKRQASGHNDFVAYWLADILYNDDQIQSAFEIMKRTMSEGQPDYYDHEFMAMLSVELEEFVLAREQIAKSLDKDPNASYPKYYEALILVHEKEYDNAEAEMRSAVQAGIEEHAVSFFLSRLFKSGEFVRAIRLGVEFRED